MTRTGNARGTQARDEGAATELASGWWPVAFAREIGPSPRAVRLGERELALFRDAAGRLCAVDDVCPHRRMPLSLGTVTPQGLQCGYHGWVFDGVDGRCRLIPDLGTDVPDRIRVASFPVAEHAGLIWVRTGGAAPDRPATAAPLVAGRTVQGSFVARSPHADVVAGLVLNVGRALGMSAVFGGGDAVFDPAWDGADGVVTVRRRRLTWPLPRVATFDSAVRRDVVATTRTHAATGTTTAVVEGPDGGQVAHIVVGSAPAGAYRTQVRWRLVSNRVPLLLVAATAAASRRRAARLLEAVADEAPDSRDPAVEWLRSPSTRTTTTTGPAAATEPTPAAAAPAL